MNTRGPLISIIIPTFNRAHLIGETLDSILAQTYQNWECIVVDDGSADNTNEVLTAYIAKDARFQYFHRPKDRLPGGNAARNYGFEMSKGKYVQWFDSDDLMIKNKLQVQINDLLRTNKKAHLCSGSRYDPYTKTLKDLKVDFTLELFCQVALNKTEVMTPALLIDRETYSNTGIGFNEVLTRGQETYFFIHLIHALDNTALILQSEKKLFKYVNYNQSISRSDEVYNLNHVKSKAIVFSSIWDINRKYNCIGLSNRMFKKCVRLLFSSIRHKDYDISKLILKEIKVNLGPENKSTYYRIYFYYLIVRVFGKPKYRLMNNILKININS